MSFHLTEEEEDRRDKEYEYRREEKEEKYRETHKKSCEFCDNVAAYKYSGDYYCEECFEILTQDFKQKHKLEED